MHAHLERSYPYAASALLGIGAGVACFYEVLKFPASSEILGSTISFAAIFAGFLATAKSILIALNTPAVEKLKTTRFYTMLLSYLAQAIWLALVLCAFCLLGYFVPHREHWLFASFWALLTSCSLLTWFRVTRAFLALM